MANERCGKVEICMFGGNKKEQPEDHISYG